MKINGKDYRSIWVEDDAIIFIDQRVLPHSFELYRARTYQDVAHAISTMIVRGAPAIGAAACYGMAIADDVDAAAAALRTTRPTAHDLFFAIDYMVRELGRGANPMAAAEAYVSDCIGRCAAIGREGAALITGGMRILTHCNAGALATVDHGTALAPLREAVRAGKTFSVFCDETRPRLQGMLTAWELGQEGIEHAIIADNAAGHFMQRGEIDMVIVGADCITAQGDAANKIGTYEKAVLAKEHGIPFYVAAPSSTINIAITDGGDIAIEERDADEVLFCGGVRVAPGQSSARNPAFDVTPARYITGIITENGIIAPGEVGRRF